MTHFLATSDKPDGWRLEDILSVLQNDITRRCTKIMDDMRPEARNVFHNNVEILHLLTECIHKAQDSSRILTRLGPPSAAGQPRIGHT